MITFQDFQSLRAALGEQAKADIEWAEALTTPTDADAYALEVIFVICNSGMKNTVARGIYERCATALAQGRPVLEVFKHPGKSAAIQSIWAGRQISFSNYLEAKDKLEYLAGIPWIGQITKYHLAKNFGADVAKPDVHLVRLADREGCTVQALCERLAAETGLRVATVDTLLWRACADGVLDSRTGLIRNGAPA